MDQMVLATQQWLNKTYSNKNGYKTIEENGKTSWAVMSALTTALQIELGIQTPNGNFGPATRAAFKSLSVNSTLKNQVCILQGALYCKGYNPTGITGTFGQNTEKAVKELQADAGIDQTGIADVKLMRALLTMDAFKLLTYGNYKSDSTIRTIQQNLNRKYSGNSYFNNDIGLIPCDGIYGRSMNKALLYALQIEEGIAAPNGVFGPTTSKLCPTLLLGSVSEFVVILKYILYCNGYGSGSFSNVFDNDTKTTVSNFQEFSALNITGVAEIQTWKSLLISCGDNTRKGTACDCSTTITKEKALTLKNNNYRVVGRYLTGRYALTSDEIAVILDSGLSIVPIYEVGGYKLEYFNQDQGISDAKAAMAAATSFGIPKNTRIYFAVDFDALDQDIDSAILPYFKGVNEVIEFYEIGIYAPRNVCSRISNARLATKSFACDMSTGFSGNLGFSLPKNWSLDQISTVTLGTGTGLIEIDNNICNNSDMGFSSVDTAAISSDLIDLIKELSAYAVRYEYENRSLENPMITVNRGVLDYLRQYKYNTSTWSKTIGDLSPFVDYMKKNYSDFNSKMLKFISEDSESVLYNNHMIDLPHLAATTLGYTDDGHWYAKLIPDFWTGWGGDLATGMADITNDKNGEHKDDSVDFIAQNYVVGVHEGSTCPRDDLNADIDSIYFAEKFSNERFDISFIDYYSKVTASMRRELFLVKDLEVKSDIDELTLTDVIYSWMTGIKGFSYPTQGGRLLALAKTKEGVEPTDETQKAACKALAKFIINM